MQTEKNSEPVRVYDKEGYYQFEKIDGPSDEIIVRAAYYQADGELDPIRTAAVPNTVLLEQFKLTLLNDLIADKDGLAHVMEEIMETIMRQGI